MKRAFIFLGFPYLVPLCVFLLAEHIWSLSRRVEPAMGSVSGGEVPAAYILLPFGVLLQILVGIPGNAVIHKASSLRPAIISLLAMALVPALVFVSNASGFLSIMAVAALGSFVSLRYLRPGRQSGNRCVEA